MILHIRIFLLLLLLSALTTLSVKAQTTPVLLNDKLQRAVEHPYHPPILGRMTGPDTLSISTSQPFFEDFSNSNTYPSSERWFNPELANRATPLQTRHAALNPPSRGVVSFDGRDAAGVPYDTKSLSFGKADLLLSHYIDLSPYNASSNIVLSFYLQPGGRAEAPEANDSFFVSFLTPTDTFQVYSQAGTGTSSNDFARISIPVNNPAWFVTAFQIAFENKGSLNGSLDVWQLDYIELGLNRNINSPPPNDQSAIGLVTSPLAPYTRVPLRHFPNTQGSMKAFDVELSNLSSNNKSAAAQADLSETFLNTPLIAPFKEAKTINLMPESNTIANFSAFAEQTFTSQSILSLQVNVGDGSDANSENDLFVEKFPIDSILAYDDGEADAGFGLNRPFGFGVQVNLEQADSLSAVWISFMPTVNFNPISNAIDYMDGKSFRFRVWSFPHPDSILFEQVNDMKVNYGSEANTFVRYPLNRKVPVSGTFWVGIQQLNTLPIGVGYDMSYDNDALCFYDSSGVWKNINFDGTLMIRPEFHNTTEVVLSVKDKLNPNLKLYPNPLYGNKVKVKVGPEIRSYKAIIFTPMGKKVYEYTHHGPAFEEIQLELPKNLPKGLYIWQHVLKNNAGEEWVQVEKLLLRPSN